MKTDEIVFGAVKIAIDEWNPYSLLPEAPRDEFDSESMEITNLISKIIDVDNIAGIIASVFSSSFGEKFTKSDCMIPAKRIVDIFQKAKE